VQRQAKFIANMARIGWLEQGRYDDTEGAEVLNKDKTFDMAIWDLQKGIVRYRMS
jgi:hypothetical protein